MTLRIAGTVNDSIVDGPGLRFTLFVQGCPHHCKGCHNPHTHDFEGGELVETDVLLERIRENPLLDGVTFSGGEPFCQAQVLAEFAKQIHAIGLNVFTYTGYTFEYLLEHREENSFGKLLEETDFLVDGPFVEELKSIELRFRGSANQRLLAVRESLAEGKAVPAQI